MSAEEVATAFVSHYYQAFDAGADSLAGLYVSFCFLDADDDGAPSGPGWGMRFYL